MQQDITNEITTQQDMANDNRSQSYVSLEINTFLGLLQMMSFLYFIFLDFITGLGYPGMRRKIKKITKKFRLRPWHVEMMLKLEKSFQKLFRLSEV